MNYIDLFAGAGGLSEGFIREGFKPVAHIEMNKEAADTLKTRLAFHYLNDNQKINQYYSYLKNEVTRDELWNGIPEEIISSVVNSEITKRTIDNSFTSIDERLYSKKVDIIIGGPPARHIH